MSRSLAIQFFPVLLSGRGFSFGAVRGEMVSYSSTAIHDEIRLTQSMTYCIPTDPFLRVAILRKRCASGGGGRRMGE